MKGRIAVALLSISATAFVAKLVEEGYSDTAIIPVKGDVPTVGFGMTKRPDGTQVQMGDKTNPVEALQRTMAYAKQDETRFKRCVKAPLHQGEFDLYLNFSYQFGMDNTCKSIAPLLNKGDYLGACNKLLEFKYVAKFDCSTPGNKRCYGVWARQLNRHEKCLALQQ